MKALPSLVILLCLFAFGAVTGGVYVHALKTAEIAGLKRDQATAAKKTAEAALQRLEAAQARADQLAADLAAAESARTQLDQEYTREIARLTTGRRCLDAAVVRVLNQPGPGNQPGAVPPAAGQPAAADGAAASDTDVAQWARLARERYDTCRGRLDALINYHQGK